MEKLSWKTSLGGIAAGLVGLGMLGNVIKNFLTGEPVSMEQVAFAIAAIGAGFTGIFARDNDVTSEEAGAK